MKGDSQLADLAPIGLENLAKKRTEKFLSQEKTPTILILCSFFSIMGKMSSNKDCICSCTWMQLIKMCMWPGYYWQYYISTFTSVFRSNAFWAALISGWLIPKENETYYASFALPWTKSPKIERKHQRNQQI